MLNDPSVVNAAVCFAARVIEHGGSSDRERVEWAWRQATSRSADEAIEILLPLVRRHRKQYADDIDAAKALVEMGDLGDRSDTDSVELAAWTSVARTILNLNEVITRN